MPHVRAVATIATAVVLVAPCGLAQVQGRVLDDAAVPLREVRVELWDAFDLRAVKTTGADGVFRLVDAGSPSPAGRRVAFRKIGFRPYTLSLGADTARIEVRLTPLPATLAAQRTSAASQALDPCTRKPTPEAAAIFRVAASHYRRDTPLFDQFVRAASQDVLVPSDQREVLPQLQLVGDNRHERLADPASLLMTGPFPAPTPRYDAAHKPSGWIFPQFEYTDAPAFVMPAFVDSMPRAVVSSGPDGMVLSFCPRNRRGAYASGEIELDRDTTIVAVRWRFIVPGARDEKGGFALFEAPPSPKETAHLLPTNAVRWTRVRRTGNFSATRYSNGPWLLRDPAQRGARP